MTSPAQPRPVRFAGDLADLPTHAFGPRSLTWWGVSGFMLIEGMGFALAFAAYFFLMAQEKQWPASALPPSLTWGTITLVLLLLSEIPNVWLKRMAEQERLREVRIGLVVMCVAALVALISRGFEFEWLNIGWDRSAYASILWALLLLHTTHMITDFIDTLVLTVLMRTGHGVEGRRFVDTSENALYWRFIVISWIAVYAVAYWAPRLSS